MAARVSSVAVALLVLGLAGSAGAVTIAIDGDATGTNDWGINPGSYGNPFNSAQWVPNSGITYVDGSEDYQPGTGGGYVNPGYGGQTYDAEASYFTYDSSYAYFAVVTGFPKVGEGGNKPGDFAIDIGRNGTWDFGIAITTHDNVTAGNLYQTTNGNWPASGNFGGVADPTWMSMGSNTPLWVASPAGSNLAYALIYSGTWNGTSNGHYLIETAVPLAYLGLSPSGPTDFRLHWTETCANDAVDLNGSFPAYPSGSPAIPEPATCTLLAGGVLAALALRRRNKGQRPKATTN